jgi:sec-independent protein translocase protein TatA
MGSFGTTEIILVVAVLFLLFGASRLPQLAKSIGQSKRAFKEGLDEAEREGTEDSKKLSSDKSAPQIIAMTDEDLLSEMQRRAEAKQS